MSRCERHGLAAGPDGECVVCKRTEPGSGFGFKAFFIALSMACAVAVGAAVWTMRRPPPAPVAALGAPAGVVAEGAYEERKAVAPPELREPAPPEGPRAAAGVPPRGAALPAGDERAGADVQAARAAELEKQRQRQDELRAAIKRVPITMYSAAWCPVCTRARDFLRGEGISFVERDIDASPAARAAQLKLNPKGSVPTMDIDGKVLVGFSPQGLRSALLEAAERRAGRF